MREFVGRSHELEMLGDLHQRIAAEIGRSKPGRLLMMRGRRRVGKSTLLEQFLSQTGSPGVFFTASRRGAREPAMFAAEVAGSNLPGAHIAAGQSPANWEAALSLLEAALPDDQVSVVIIDEFPYLLEPDQAIEAVFQKTWDRRLSTKPVLLVLVGSDLAMMERLDDADRALHQRGTEMVVSALSPFEAAQIVGTGSAADAFDAYLITGGLPLICDDWPAGASMWTYLEQALSHATSPLIVSAERSLKAEFPVEAQAQDVLAQIGAGSVTFSTIARAQGGMQGTSLSRALELLAAKRMVARDLPLSTSPSKESRYRVTDPYLQFWLQFIGPHLSEIERGRGDRVLERIRQGWTSWRGKAIEPVIHESLRRLMPIDDFPDAMVIGAYWTRSNDPEVDIVGADRGPIAKRIAFTGTIKWLENAGLDQGDLNQLATDTAKIPGGDPSTPHLAISRNGVSGKGAALSLGPDELLAAWA